MADHRELGPLREVTPTPGSVRSKDGTTIGYLRLGAGPPLVMVHGSLGVAESWLPAANLLADSFTCYLMDRRGRGRSGDAPDYAIDREYEDVAAVLAAAGEKPYLFGHSYGAICALGAALQVPIDRLILYEPPIPAGGPITASQLENYRNAVAAGDPARALEIALIRLVGLPPEGFEALRTSPIWERMLSLAPGFVRELVAIDQLGRNLDHYSALGVPTLLLIGEETKDHPSYKHATAGLSKTLKNVRASELVGQGHVAHVTAPQLVAGRVREFLA